MELSTIKLTRGIPPLESFPITDLAECSRQVMLAQGKDVLQYGPSYGFAPLREYIASLTGVSEGQVILGQGSLQLLDLTVRMLIRPGDLVYTEEPSYDRTLTVLRRAGAHVLGFPLGLDGPDTDAIEAHLKRGERPVLFYLIPDFQNPSGTVMAEAKRQHIARLARDYNFLVVEDAPYRSLRYRNQALPRIFDLIPDHVLLMSSYSKLIAPGLRLGYAITPQKLGNRLAKWAEDTYISGSFFNQAIVFEYIQRGLLDTHLIELKNLYRDRLDAMLAALDTDFSDLGTWPKPDGGFFVGLTLNPGTAVAGLLSAAASQNMLLTDGCGFFNGGGGEDFIRLPFCALPPEEIREGIARLAGIVRSLPHF